MGYIYMRCNMTCPNCDNKMKVKDVREDYYGPIRRYKCLNCGLDLYTGEVEISKYEFHNRYIEAKKRKLLLKITEELRGEKHEV